MTPNEAQAAYGATHYSTRRDGVTPQMYYKQQPVDPYVAGSPVIWVYLSFANLWMGSSINTGEAINLTEITEGE